jgi:hypothetical protein
MTPSKVINRLMRDLPPLLAHTVLSRNRCILATRLGIDALAHFGIEAVPRSVSTAVANDHYVQWHIDSVDAVTPIEPPATAHCVWVGVTADDVQPNGVDETAKTWNGHVVVYVPARTLMLDLDFQAFARPAKRLALPPAVAAEWPPDLDVINYQQRDARGRPFVAHYERADGNTGYTVAADWRSERPFVAALVKTLVEHMRQR